MSIDEKRPKLTKKNIHSNNSSGRPLPDNYNTSRQQSICRKNYRGRSPNNETQGNSQKIDKIDQTVKTINIEKIIQDQTQTEIITPIKIDIFSIQSPKIKRPF